MRIVLLNPHTFHFKKILARFFNGKKNLFRYSYLLENRKDELEIALMANGSRTSFQKAYLRKILLNRFGGLLEITLWLLLNRLNPFRYKIYSTTRRLDPSHDILFTFGVDICQLTPNQLKDLQRFEGIILVHLTHYFYNPVGIAKVCSELKNVVFISESDLTSNSFFKEFFPAESRLVLLPFVFNERFAQKVSQVRRSDNCIAVGTLLRVNQVEYSNFFGPDNPVLQPMRREIFDNAIQYPDIFINIMRDQEKLRVGSVEGNLNSASTETEIEKSYYKIGLANLFHSNAMFISPEESIGLPSSNFVDGMVSGCVYVGADLSLYERFGMLGGVHYISYKEEDFEDLLKKIRYYQENPDQLQEISAAGREFALTHFSPEIVRKKFKSELEKLYLKV